MNCLESDVMWYKYMYVGIACAIRLVECGYIASKQPLRLLWTEHCYCVSFVALQGVSQCDAPPEDSQ